jgi:hypothetical protein
MSIKMYDSSSRMVLFDYTELHLDERKDLTYNNLNLKIKTITLEYEWSGDLCLFNPDILNKASAVAYYLTP